MSRSPGPMRCSEHEGKPYEFYCRQCKSLACSMCVLLVHRDHTTEVSEAADVLPEHMESLKGLYKEASAHLETAQDMMDNSAASIAKLKENKEFAEKRIHSYFQRVRNILVDRENHFINTIRRNAEEKKKASSNVRRSLSELFQSLMFCVKGLWELSSRDEADIMLLMEEEKLVAELEKATKTLKDLQKKDELLNPDATITLPCIEDRNFEKICRMIGDPSFTTCPPDCCSTAAAPFSNGGIGGNNERLFLLTPPPLPPKVPVKERTSTDPHVESNHILLTRPDSHPRSNSSIELTESVTESLESVTAPPPVPPRSPKQSKKPPLPQWLLEYKEKADKENRKSTEVRNGDIARVPMKKTSSDNVPDVVCNDNGPHESVTESQLTPPPQHRPKPKPRQSLPCKVHQQQRSDSIYEIPVSSKRNKSIPNSILLSKLDTDNLKSRIVPPVIEKPEPNSRTSSGSSSTSNECTDQIPVYEILLKRNLKKGPFCPSGVCVGECKYTFYYC